MCVIDEKWFWFKMKHKPYFVLQHTFSTYDILHIFKSNGLIFLQGEASIE